MIFSCFTFSWRSDSSSSLMSCTCADRPTLRLRQEGQQVCDHQGLIKIKKRTREATSAVCAGSSLLQLCNRVCKCVMICTQAGRIYVSVRQHMLSAHELQQPGPVAVT